MDIAKYASLFFLRSQYLYLPSVGNLEVKKIPSSYSTELGSVESKEMTILFKPMMGVIDDNFANFIANNERVSIASAANAIREFGTITKKLVSEGESVALPGVGMFFNNNGAIDFKAEDNIELVKKSIPVFKNSTIIDEPKEKGIKEILETTHFRQPTADEEVILDKPKVNYGKIALLIALGLLILGGLGYLIYYFTSVYNKSEADTEQVEPVTIDSDTAISDSNTAIVQNAADGSVYSIIVKESKDSNSIKNRVKNLEINGYTSRYVGRDSVYYAVVDIPKTAGPDSSVVDSIRVLLNPAYNVRILD